MIAVIAGASAFITLKVEGLESTVAVLKTTIYPAYPENPANTNAGISFKFGKETFSFISIKMAIMDTKKFFLNSFFSIPLFLNIKFILTQKVEILNKILYNLKG